MNVFWTLLGAYLVLVLLFLVCPLPYPLPTESDYAHARFPSWHLYYFHKYLHAGTYSVTVSANGYLTRTIDSIVVPSDTFVFADVALVPDTTRPWCAFQVITNEISNTNQSDAWWALRERDGRGSRVWLGSMRFLRRRRRRYHSNDATSSSPRPRASSRWRSSTRAVARASP